MRCVRQSSAYLSLLLISCCWCVPQVSGQTLQTASPHVSAALPPVDVPRQLTLDTAEQLLVQHNLAVITARYGVDNTRAQRLIASVRPNPTLTLGAEL